MKKIYWAPSLREHLIGTNFMLCVSGNTDSGSGSNEGEEYMGVKRNNYTTNPVQWEDWQ